MDGQEWKILNTEDVWCHARCVVLDASHPDEMIWCCCSNKNAKVSGDMAKKKPPSSHHISTNTTIHGDLLSLSCRISSINESMI